MKISVSIPNDYDSEHDYEAAIKDQYGDCGESYEEMLEAASNDSIERLFDELAEGAKRARFVFVKATDFGGIWEGNNIKSLQEELPKWAYTGTIEA